MRKGALVGLGAGGKDGRTGRLARRGTTIQDNNIINWNGTAGAQGNGTDMARQEGWRTGVQDAGLGYLRVGKQVRQSGRRRWGVCVEGATTRSDNIVVNKQYCTSMTYISITQIIELNRPNSKKTIDLTTKNNTKQYQNNTVKKNNRNNNAKQFYKQ